MILWEPWGFIASVQLNRRLSLDIFTFCIIPDLITQLPWSNPLREFFFEAESKTESMSKRIEWFIVYVKAGHLKLEVAHPSKEYW